MDTFQGFQRRVSKVLDLVDDDNLALSKKLGINRGTVSRYRKGQGDLKGVAIHGLVHVYKARPDFLLLGEPPIFLGSDGQAFTNHKDAEMEIMRVKLAAKEAEVTFLRQIHPSDSPSEIRQKLSFATEMAGRFKHFRESLMGEETAQ